MQANGAAPKARSGILEALGPRELLLGAAVYLVGVATAVALHWPALMHYGIFKDDTVQSPHWAAYHQTSFLPGDLVLRYASFNESPLQNAIYWLGTWFVESITLGKILGIASYGLLGLVFFLVGRALHGTRFGLLLALFILFFPDQWDFSAGFFSKFWMIPLLLICVYVLESGRFKALIGLLPFAAVAYPTAAVLIGMTATVFWIQEVWAGGGRARKLFRALAIGSLLAVVLLSVKYVAPPEFIGPMRPGAELKEMPEVRDGGYPSHYVPVPPLSYALLVHVVHPFVVFGAVFYFLVLGRKGVGWDRSWTALFLASAVGYLLADYFFMRFYIPNRYTRYSMALLLALWNARNWDLILARVHWRSARIAMVAALLVCAGYSYAVSFEPERGWSDRRKMSGAARFLREDLPERILVAGSPKRMDDVMVQGKRSVLTPYKLAHPWFTLYYDEIRERTRATLRAHFAAGPRPLNALHERYGVTHFLVEKELFYLAERDRKLFANPYSEEVYQELGKRREFYLDPVPVQLLLWEDEKYAIVELPLPTGRP
jgi:hypothetical protein